MKTISFSININAPINRVWNAIWDDGNYREWTKYFYPGSFYESDWKVGGKTLFLGPDRSGMYATITKLEMPYEVIFNHLGEVDKGVEVLKYDIDTFEKYLLSETDGVTTLTVSVDIPEEYEEDMDNGFKKGFEEIKRISESNR